MNCSASRSTDLPGDLFDMSMHNVNNSSKLLNNVRSTLPAGMPELDPHTLQRFKEQALAKAKALQAQVCPPPGTSTTRL